MLSKYELNHQEGNENTFSNPLSEKRPSGSIPYWPVDLAYNSKKTLFDRNATNSISCANGNTNEETDFLPKNYPIRTQKPVLEPFAYRGSGLAIYSP